MHSTQIKKFPSNKYTYIIIYNTRCVTFVQSINHVFLA